MTSIKPLSEISAIPAKWIPGSVHGQFYVNVFMKHPFARYLLNSFIVALTTTLSAILIGASAAYALARLRFKGKKDHAYANLKYFHVPDNRNLKSYLSAFEKFEAPEYLSGFDSAVHYLCASFGNLAADKFLCTASPGDLRRLRRLTDAPGQKYFLRSCFR